MRNNGADIRGTRWECMEIRLEGEHSVAAVGRERCRWGDRLGRFDRRTPRRRRDGRRLSRRATRSCGATWRSRFRRSFSRDPDRQRRFEREARAAASLNHPNILAVHDVGVHHGIAFIVTELLVGETLREDERTALVASRMAVDYATQVASGLAAAHERGDRASGHQTGQSVRHQRRTGQDSRLRPGQVDRPGCLGGRVDVHRRRHRRRPVLGPRSTCRRSRPAAAARTIGRHFQPGNRAVRDAAGFRAVPAEHRGGDARCDRPRRAAVTSAPFRSRPALDRLVRHCLRRTRRAIPERYAIWPSISMHCREQWTGATVPAGDCERSGLERRVARHRGRPPLDRRRARLVWLVKRCGGRLADRGTVHRLTDFPGIEESPSISRIDAGRLHRRRQRATADLRAADRGRPAVADHPGCSRSPAASLVARRELAAVFLAGRARRDPGHDVDRPRAGGLFAPGDGQYRRRRHQPDGARPCFSLIGERVQLVTAALDGSDVRTVCAIRRGLSAVSALVPRGNRLIAFRTRRRGAQRSLRRAPPRVASRASSRTTAT